MFKFGSFLGAEIFYAILFSFLIWNVDSVVGRRVYFVGYITFYIGQVGMLSQPTTKLSSLRP